MTSTAALPAAALPGDIEVPFTALAVVPRSAPGVVLGAPNLVLRAEGAVVLAGAAIAYAQTGVGWALFAALFLLPDLSMLGYLKNPRMGAATYNLGHSYLVTLSVVALGLAAGLPLLTAGGLVWTAHVGFDRLLGYGLKYASGFKDTHLSAATKEAEKVGR